MTRKNTLAAIAMLLMAILFVTGCQMSSSGNVPSTPDAMAVSAFRAMAQVADIETPVQNGDYKTYTPTEFKADDGSVISGTFQLDAEGNVVDANLTLTLVSGQKVQFTMVKQTETAQPEITVDDQPVSETVVPDTMTDEESMAFMAFLIGFDEIQDEIRGEIKDIFDDLYDDDDDYGRRLSPGDYPVPEAFRNFGISGTVTVGYDEWDDDDDLEIVGGNLTFDEFRLDYGSVVSGSYSFTDRDDYEDADMNISITSFEEDGITISNARIDGKIVESEIHDDNDKFKFEGSISGRFSVRNGESAEISFSGKMDAMEDRYLEFPEYELTINGNQVAIGKENRPFRNN